MTKVETSPVSGRLSDDEAIEALKEVLELRRQVEAGGAIGHYASGRITSTFNEITRDIFAPVWRHTGTILSSEEFRKLTVSQKRAYIADLSHSGIPLLPVDISHLVMYAFQSVNAGVEPPLFRRTFKSKGINPEFTARAKLALLKWIYWRMGCGSSEAEAWKQGAGAVNRSVTSVKAWQVALIRIFGTEHIAYELESTRDVGRAQAERMTYTDLRPSTSDRHSYLQEAWAFERDLTKLANELKKFEGKRIIPKA